MIVRQLDSSLYISRVMQAFDLSGTELPGSNEVMAGIDSNPYTSLRIEEVCDLDCHTIRSRNHVNIGAVHLAAIYLFKLLCCIVVPSTNDAKGIRVSTKRMLQFPWLDGELNRHNVPIALAHRAPRYTCIPHRYTIFSVQRTCVALACPCGYS